ncbi:MAG: hypothetical protein IH965_10520 [Gemmatimonadetes bacterium]|nr:hypothetical protein [Gemmatimonadota bacterium]
MAPRDIFGVLIRLVGLGLVLYSISKLLVAAFIKFSPVWGMVQDVGGTFSTSTVTLMDTGTLMAVIQALLAIAIGAYLLRGAPRLMRYCYPDSLSSRP